MGWSGDYYPKKTTPRRVEDGIAARNQRGSFASQWWAKRWIQALEAFGWDSRLARGRAYARKGQVVDYQVAPGCVTARVQGSRPRPYGVTIALNRLDDAAWDSVVTCMAERASFAARLLAGEMPQDIEEAFTAAGQSLMPQQARDLQTKCSCPDSANPCKHIAAVYYILAEAFDQDPFLIFQLRGRSRENLLEALRQRRCGAADEETEATDAVAAVEDLPEEAPPLPADPLAFWTGAAVPEMFDVGLEAPHVPHAVLTRLGSPGPWAGASEFERVLAPAWERACAYARGLALGEAVVAEATQSSQKARA